MEIFNQYCRSLTLIARRRRRPRLDFAHAAVQHGIVALWQNGKRTSSINLLGLSRARVRIFGSTWLRRTICTLWREGWMRNLPQSFAGSIPSYRCNLMSTRAASRNLRPSCLNSFHACFHILQKQFYNLVNVLRHFFIRVVLRITTLQCRARSKIAILTNWPVRLL